MVVLRVLYRMVEGLRACRAFGECGCLGFEKNGGFLGWRLDGIDSSRR